MSHMSHSRYFRHMRAVAREALAPRFGESWVNPDVGTAAIIAAAYNGQRDLPVTLGFVLRNAQYATDYANAWPATRADLNDLATGQHAVNVIAFKLGRHPSPGEELPPSG